MPTLRSEIDLRSDEFVANRAHNLGMLKLLDDQLAVARAGGGEAYMARHRARGRFTVRERIDLLVDPGSAFLELSPLAAWGTDFTVGASVVTGIGVIHGVECLFIGNDGTVKGGTSNPYTWKKMLRALHIARLNRLPLINLVESGGADLPTQADLFVPAGSVVPGHHAALGDGHPHRRAGVRQLHRRRRVRARHVRLQRDDRQAVEGVPRRPPAGQDGHR